MLKYLNIRYAGVGFIIIHMMMGIMRMIEIRGYEEMVDIRILVPTIMAMYIVGWLWTGILRSVTNTK